MLDVRDKIVTHEAPLATNFSCRKFMFQDEAVDGVAVNTEEVSSL
jgi:hypothetical protein